MVYRVEEMRTDDGRECWLIPVVPRLPSRHIENEYIKV